VSIEITTLLGPVKEITAEAGVRILAIYATAFAVAEKDDASPLTAADLASHEAILSGLQRLTPDIPILSEESSAVPFAERISWDYFWLVDPLDGTKEFIKRYETTMNEQRLADMLGITRKALWEKRKRWGLLKK